MDDKRRISLLERHEYIRAFKDFFDNLYKRISSLNSKLNTSKRKYNAKNK